jgi:hypothetical protein
MRERMMAVVMLEKAETGGNVEVGASVHPG